MNLGTIVPPAALLRNGGVCGAIEPPMNGLCKRKPSDAATRNTTAARVSAVNERETGNGNVAGRSIDLGAKTRMVKTVLVKISRR